MILPTGRPRQLVFIAVA